MKCAFHCPADAKGSGVGAIASIGISLVMWIVVMASYIEVYCIVPTQLLGSWSAKLVLISIAIGVIYGAVTNKLRTLVSRKAQLFHVGAAVGWSSLVSLGIPPVVLAAPIVGLAGIRSKPAIQQQLALMRGRRSALTASKRHELERPLKGVLSNDKPSPIHISNR